MYIVKGFKVTVDIQKFKFKLNEITENNIDPTLDPRDISSFIGFISGFLRNYINQFVSHELKYFNTKNRFVLADCVTTLV